MGECLVICAHCGKPKYSHGLGTEACPTPGWSVGDPMENRWGDTTFMAIPIPPGMGAEHVLAQEIRSVSSTGAEKGTKLERFDLIPDIPLRMLARHYGVGAQKYAERNWELGYEWSKSFAALNRHLWAFWGGEDIDAETSMPHMIAVAWHALALVEFSITHPEFDDRPTGFEEER
jgi:hypothetical protein